MSRSYLYDGPALSLNFNDKIYVNDKRVSIADENDYLGVTFCCMVGGWDLDIWHDGQNIELDAFDSVTIIRKEEVILYFTSNGLWFDIVSLFDLDDYIPYQEMTVEEIRAKIQKYMDEEDSISEND